jgi:hypothetical protein
MPSFVGRSRPVVRWSELDKLCICKCNLTQYLADESYKVSTILAPFPALVLPSTRFNAIRKGTKCIRLATRIENVASNAAHEERGRLKQHA